MSRRCTQIVQCPECPSGESTDCPNHPQTYTIIQCTVCWRGIHQELSPLKETPSWKDLNRTARQLLYPIPLDSKSSLEFSIQEYHNTTTFYEPTSYEPCTDKKENQIFLIYREIQSGEVAKSYMRKGFLIYEEMRKYFPIYEEAVSHIWLCNCSTLNFPIYEENLIFFFISSPSSLKFPPAVQARPGYMADRANSLCMQCPWAWLFNTQAVHGFAAQALFFYSLS